MICCVKGCNKKAVTRGWCGRHYQRWLKWGDPTFTLRSRGETLEFIIKAFKFRNECCLEWPFHTDIGGYGRITIKGRDYMVHRLILASRSKRPYSTKKNPLQAAHNCGNPRCVNPRHLRWDTRSGNQQDRIYHGTQHNAKLSDADILEIHRRAIRGEHQPTIAADYGISQAYVSEIKHKRSRKRLLCQVA